MNIDNLVRMANQIGAFFSAYPNREEAMEGIATHIHKFWEPRMRILILDNLSSERTSDLLPIVRESLSQYAARMRPSLTASST